MRSSVGMIRSTVAVKSCSPYSFVCYVLNSLFTLQGIPVFAGGQPLRSRHCGPCTERGHSHGTPSPLRRSYQVASRYRMGWRVRHRRSATSAHKWKDRDLPQARSETLLGGGPLPDQPSTTRQSSRPFGRRCNLPRPTFRSTFAMRVPRALWTRSRLAMILSSYCAEHGCKLTSDHGCRIDILPPSDAAPGVASASSRNWPSSLSGPLGVRTVKCRSVSSQ